MNTLALMKNATLKQACVHAHVVNKQQFSERNVNQENDTRKEMHILSISPWLIINAPS